MVNVLRIVGVVLILLGGLFSIASMGDLGNGYGLQQAMIDGVGGMALLVVGVVCLYLSYRRIVSVKPSSTEIVREREIIKEVVMIPCRYCGGLMPQASTFCPNCGARRQSG